MKDMPGCQGGRKRIFIGLLCAVCLGICLLFLFLLVLPWIWHSVWLPYASIGAGCLGIGLLAWLCASLVFHIYTGCSFPGISGARHAAIRLLLPLMELAGQLCGLDKSITRRSFVRVNNEFAIARGPIKDAGKLLLLLPHCMQASSCPRRLVWSVDNCAACGACQIGALRGLARRRGFRLAIATGGTVARKIVVETRPERIIAVACERDLCSGIQDAYPIPVIGVLNKRPNGPCRDTLAPWEDLRLALAACLGEDRTPAEVPVQPQQGYCNE